MLMPLPFFEILSCLELITYSKNKSQLPRSSKLFSKYAFVNSTLGFLIVITFKGFPITLQIPAIPLIKCLLTKALSSLLKFNPLVFILPSFCKAKMILLSAVETTATPFMSLIYQVLKSESVLFLSFTLFFTTFKILKSQSFSLTKDSKGDILGDEIIKL